MQTQAQNSPMHAILITRHPPPNPTPPATAAAAVPTQFEEEGPPVLTHGVADPCCTV